MTYDETEQCYVATVTTTVADDGKSKFRFVANHTASSNWYEDTTNDPTMKARVEYNKPGVGHTAAANDPNKVSYKKKEQMILQLILSGTAQKELGLYVFTSIHIVRMVSILQLTTITPLARRRNWICATSVM